MNKALADIYYNPKNSASFGSAQKLYKAVKEKFPTATLIDVQNWLSGELAYTLHYPARRRFQRNKIVVTCMDEQWEADLVDMKEVSRHNDNYKYILTVIDSLSKYAWAVPLRLKDGKSLVRAYSSIFKQRKPVRLRTDKGTEFLNTDVQLLLKEYKIFHFTSHDDNVKCAIVERFNRTLKDKMFKYFTAIGRKRYIDKLQDFLSSYNHAKHRSIKMRPIDVTLDNDEIAFQNLYGVSSLREMRKGKSNLKVGDKVRMRYILGPLDRGYYPNWTDNIYTIAKVINGPIPVYHLTDSEGVILKQRFYDKDLQKVKENLYRIEKVLKQRVRKGKLECFVKWLNYPSTQNSWIPKEEIQRLSESVRQT